MKRFISCAVALSMFAVASSTASAGSLVELAKWTFETSVPTTAGPHSAEGGLNAGAGSPATGFHTVGAAVYSNPVGNGSFESFSSNNWSEGDYYMFRTSTLGYEGITIQWEQTRSSTGPSEFDLEWSTDGTNFTALVVDYVINQVTWSSGAYTAGSLFGPHTGPSNLDNQAAVYFRMVSKQTTASAGTNRIDDVTISGTLIPEPGTLGLLALGALLGLRRRR